jgi:hypothetical protein
MVILFSTDSYDLLFISQFMFQILNSNCLLLAFICVSHVNFLKRILWKGIESPEIKTEMEVKKEMQGIK